MTEHFKKVCRVCLKVIAQCRCMDCNKVTQYGFCDDHSETKPSPPSADLSRLYDSAVGESPNIEPLKPGVEKRQGLKFITAAPDGEEIVAMTLHQFTVYVATSRAVYRLINDKLEPV